MKKNALSRGFTLIELLVVITIIAVLASMSMPAFTKIQMNAKITNDINNARQIVIACRTFAADENDNFPYQAEGEDEGGGGGGDEEGGLSSATDAFNVLIPQYVDTESIFWVPGNRDKPQPPIEDNNLEQQEVGYSYVSGQLATDFSRSPLVADEMEGEGEYGENHPWLAAQKAVVGFIGGQVAALKLTEDKAGATVRSKDKQMDNIFEERSDEGGGGLRQAGTEILAP